jgi:hypothetical protein
MNARDGTSEGLLAGPRGRRLCLSLLTAAGPSLRSLVWQWQSETGGAGTRYVFLTDDSGIAPEPAPPEPAPSVTRSDVVDAIGHLAPEVTPSALMAALAESVDVARYWQEPDEVDALLMDLSIRDALLPVAEAIISSADAAWWSTTLDRQHQRYVQWLDETPMEPPALTSALANLARWRAFTRDDEARAIERPRNVAANFSGAWGSSPAGVPLVTTTRAVPALGAVKLALTEDSFGWEKARVWPLQPSSECQVFEITGPDAWVELVRRYPMDVSLSRRHDWWRATGHEGTWLIPDWAAVASDFDAVHLTMLGYLATAGRALPVGDSHTVLAGWNPDETYWLADVLTKDGVPEDWCRDRRGLWR